MTKLPVSMLWVNISKSALFLCSKEEEENFCLKSRVDS